MEGAADRFGPKLPPINLYAMAQWSYVLEYREHRKMTENVTESLKADLVKNIDLMLRYRGVLEDIRDFGAYRGAKLRAKEGLDLSKPFVPSVPIKTTGSSAKN